MQIDKYRKRGWAHPNVADQRHVFALDDLEVHGGGGDLGQAGELRLGQVGDGGAVQPLGRQAPGLDRVRHRKVFQPALQLVQPAVAVPSVAVQCQVPV